MKQFDPVKSALSNNIRRLREIRNFTQSYMARQLEMTQGNYARLERGEISLTDERLNRIAEILQFSKDDIVQLNSETLFERRLTGPKPEAFDRDSKSVHEDMHYYKISPELKTLYESRIRQLEDYVRELKLKLQDKEKNISG